MSLEEEFKVMDSKDRIPNELQGRSGVDRMLNKWLQDIPTEPHEIDEAVELVQRLVLKTYSFIRSQVCDQAEIVIESFFKLPMLRRLNEDMNDIQLIDEDKAKYDARRQRLANVKQETSAMLTEVRWCIKRLTDFKMQTMARV